MDPAYERIDLALRWPPLPSTDLVSTPVAGVAWVIAAAPAYLRGAPPLRHPRDLAQHPCMSCWREQSDDVWTLASGKRREQVRVHGRYHTNSPDGVADAALAGLGVALLPSYTCSDALADGRLAALLPAWMPEARYGNRITAVAAPERMRLVRNQALLAFLRQRLHPPT